MSLIDATVVGGDDNNGFVGNAGLFNRFDNTAYITIEACQGLIIARCIVSVLMSGMVRFVKNNRCENRLFLRDIGDGHIAQLPREFLIIGRLLPVIDGKCVNQILNPIPLKKFIKEFKIKKENIFVIGSHGQTVVHLPEARVPSTFQIGTSAFLSAELETPVVGNFREKDMALGGQGAPLVPFFDEYIWGKGAPKVLVNIGGISNISIVGKNIKTHGFDTGPGNCLMDSAVSAAFKNKKTYDKNGALSAKGKVNGKILAAMMKDKYFAKKPPKSLDRFYFDGKFLKKFFPVINTQNISDVLATLNMFTARSVALGINQISHKHKPAEAVFAGGGFYNKTLMQNIKTLLPGIKITDTYSYNIDPHAKESAAFALMAALALEHKTNHSPFVTGARKKTVLGEVCP